MLYYIGRFPPPYGGVTIKNNLMINKLAKKVPIKIIDTNNLKMTKPLEVLRFLLIIINSNSRFIIGLSFAWRYKLSKFLYIFNKNTLRKSLLIVMGGTIVSDLAKNDVSKESIRNYKRIYVETDSMKSKLENLGINNVSVYPNCREKPEYEIKIKKRQGKLRCVFFSMIYPEKGVDVILDAAVNLPDIEFDFWGDINKDYKEEFLQTISRLSNCRYCGVFKSNEDNVYKLLNSYDVLLFPTRWKDEGVPGVLIEAKFSGLPAIVSNFAYNAELLEHLKEGIVLSKNDVNRLREAILQLDKDDNLLTKLKLGALRSSEKYVIDSYIDDIVNELD